MFDATPDPSTEEASSADPTVAVCERHLRLLEEVAEVAMEVTRASGAAAVAGARAAAQIVSPEEGWCSEIDKARAFMASKDASEAFQKVTRTLRLTFALEKATAETLRDLRAGILPEPKSTPTPRRPDIPAANGASAATPPHGLREKIRDAVTDVIMAAADITPAREFADDLRERLTESDNFGALLRLPLREVIQQISPDLNLSSRWLDLFGDELEPPPPAPPPEWTIVGKSGSRDIHCVRRETPPPAPGLVGPPDPPIETRWPTPPPAP